MSRRRTAHISSRPNRDDSAVPACVHWVGRSFQTCPDRRQYHACCTENEARENRRGCLQAWLAPLLRIGAGLSRRPATGESKCQRADLRKLPDKGQVRVFFVLSAFGSRDVVAASPRNYSGFCVAPNFPRKRRTPGWRRASQRTGARSGSRTWTAAAQSLIVHLVPVQCWLVAPALRDPFCDP